MKNPDANPYTKLITTLPNVVAINTDSTPTLEEVQNVRKILTNFKSAVVELGSGSGAHLLGLAHRDPKTAFFGFELRYKRAFKTAEKSIKAGLENLFVLRTNANFIPDLFPASSLNGIYMNFSDPWDRRRWKKNRMASDNFFRSAKLILKSNGFFSFKTDHQDLFVDTLDVISQHSSFSITEKTFDLYSSAFVKDNIQSEFERLFISKKLPIYYFKANIV